MGLKERQTALQLQGRVRPKGVKFKELLDSVNRRFFETLPPLKTVGKSKADISLLIYDLELFKEDGQAKFTLIKTDEVFTEFEPSLLAITTASPGNIDDFIKLLQEKLVRRLQARLKP